MKDPIERQDAIDAVHAEFDECLVWDESGRRTANEVEDILYRVPSAQPLSEADLTELQDRFGEYVRFVVEDMISGRGERWERKS